MFLSTSCRLDTAPFSSTDTRFRHTEASQHPLHGTPQSAMTAACEAAGVGVARGSARVRSSPPPPPAAAQCRRRQHSASITCRNRANGSSVLAVAVLRVVVVARHCDCGGLGCDGDEGSVAECTGTCAAAVGKAAVEIITSARRVTPMSGVAVRKGTASEAAQRAGGGAITNRSAPRPLLRQLR